MISVAHVIEWMRKRLFFYRDTNRYIPKKRAMRRPHLHNFLKRDIARRFFEKKKKKWTTVDAQSNFQPLNRASELRNNNS